MLFSFSSVKKHISQIDCMSPERMDLIQIKKLCCGKVWIFYLHAVVPFSAMALGGLLDLRTATQRADQGRSE